MQPATPLELLAIVGLWAVLAVIIVLAVSIPINLFRIHRRLRERNNLLRSLEHRYSRQGRADPNDPALRALFNG